MGCRSKWRKLKYDGRWALLAAGQITMRKVDGWQTLASKGDRRGH
jgi:hypothetical protein